MPELPDIVILARSMDEALRGKTIAAVEVNQPKCLNLEPDDFAEKVAGRTLGAIRQRGKWVLCDLDDGSTLALNQGMGGEVRLHHAGESPDPAHERVVFRFADGDQLWIHHWWFGNVHWIAPGALGAHPQIGDLGVEPLDPSFTVEKLADMLNGKRGRIKSYLLDQRFIAGIGNVYVQDALWYARLHPERKASALDADDIARLHAGILTTLNDGIDMGPGPGEQDVYGRTGTWTEHRRIGYRAGEPCPRCATPIEEIRVGSTVSFICPQCQT
jgi:formamidopyrimidine-DNA glycosylase